MTYVGYITKENEVIKTVGLNDILGISIMALITPKCYIKFFGIKYQVMSILIDLDEEIVKLKLRSIDRNEMDLK